jgi:hypothetical protein
MSFICRNLLTCIFILFFSISLVESTELNNFNASQKTYGGMGLIEMPSARMSDDGTFSIGVSSESPYNRLFAKVQFFPWMEAVVRYTEGKFTPYNTGSLQTWKDKGIDVKFLLLDEREYVPQISLGFMDLGGTGSFSSEYIVASKKLNNFDFSLGLGWGKLSGVDHLKNPLIWIDESKKNRGGYESLGGILNTQLLFSGESASFFGGIEYETPIRNLTVKLEYDSSDYSEAIGKPKNFFSDSEIFEIDSRFNAGINYSIKTSRRDNIDLSIGYVRGNTLYANIAVNTNLNLAIDKFRAPKEVVNTPYLEPFQDLTEDYQQYLSDLIMWQMGNVGFVTHRLIFDNDELTAEISQSRFPNSINAIDLASRILANNAPKNIKRINVVNIDSGIETLTSSIPLELLAESVSKGPLEEDLVEFNNLDDYSGDAHIKDNNLLYPNFYWELKPHMLGTLQHQIQFYFWQLEALFSSTYSIRKGLYLSTDIGIDIVNNYDDYTYHIPDGKLYHVRQDRRLYLTEGESGIRRMALDYIFAFNSNIKGKVSVGYLEWMYGGVGGEFLYTPDHNKWSIGLESYWVKQRDFDQKFSFRDYQTTTSLLTHYYNIPFYQLRLKTSFGKFLGKDKGVNFDLSRRFRSGARIGAMAALTNCDASCVGGGSFNKGIYFTMPMDMFYIKSSTRGKSTYGWSPLTKDAGTRIEAGSLYNLVSDAPDEVETLRRKDWSFKKIFSGFATSPKQT